MLVNTGQGGFPIHRQVGPFFRETCHAERQDPIDDANGSDVGVRDAATGIRSFSSVGALC